MENNAIQNVFTGKALITSFKNAELAKATKELEAINLKGAKLFNSTKEQVNALNIEKAKIYGRILDTACYKEDGFKSLQEYAEKVFGDKKASAYSLATVGNRFLNKELPEAIKPVVNAIIDNGVFNASELASMTNEQIEDAIKSEKLSVNGTQKQFRELATSVKPAKVINEKLCSFNAVVVNMVDGKAETIDGNKLPLDNADIMKAIGFDGSVDKIVKLFNITQVVHKEGKEDSEKSIGYTALAYTVDGNYTARLNIYYVEKPKVEKPKAEKPKVDAEEYKAFLAWKASQGK